MRLNDSCTRSFVRAVAFLLALAAFAPAATAQQVAAKSAAYTQGLLWKIEGRSRDPSYVFGTIHISDPRVTALPEVVRKRFDASSAFAAEITLDASALLQAADRMIYKDGRDLEKVVGASLYRQAVRAMIELGMPDEVVRRMKPWSIGLMLSMPESDPQNVLDFALQRLAAEQKKKMHALETVDEQFEVFDGLNERDQIAFMRHAVETRDQLAALTQRMVAAYLARDLAALVRINEEDSARSALQAVSATLEQRLLYDRNVRMARRAEALFTDGNAFVALGALHLYGERGVLAELARRGFRVSRVY